MRQSRGDRKSTRLNSSHTEIYTLSLHDALPISLLRTAGGLLRRHIMTAMITAHTARSAKPINAAIEGRSEEHTSELQSHRDLHSFPTRRSSDLPTEDGRRIAPAPHHDGHDYRPHGQKCQANQCGNRGDESLVAHSYPADDVRDASGCGQPAE